jgi:hypothetical protein
VNEAVEVVPFGPTTSIGNVIVVDAGGDACRVKLAVPRTASVEEFVAVTVTLVCVATLLGAEYMPLDEMLPVELTAQATLVPEGRF